MHEDIFDISPVLDPTIAVFPGDTPLVREVLLDMHRGDALTLSTLRTTVHVGAHADAASHYGKDAPTIDQMPLTHYLGPCRVIHAQPPPDQGITPDHLPPDLDTPRLLIRTSSQPDKAIFNKDFTPLTAELIDHLADRGVITVGVDTPSVDHADSKNLPVHARFLAHSIAIIEGLVLENVPEGDYELIALPLRLRGFDASPVRAILRTL